MTKVFAALVVLTIFIMPILSGIFILRWVRRKPKKKIGMSILIMLGCFILFVVLGTLTDPATWCEHEYEVLEESAASCSEEGYVLKHCSKCDRNNKETIPMLDHDYFSVIIDPTEFSKGYTHYFCNLCSYEYKDDFTDKLKPSSTDSSSTNTNPLEPAPDNSYPETESDIETLQEENVPGRNHEFDFTPVISDEILIKNLKAVLGQIGVNEQKISELKKVDDWAGGSRYSFSYLGWSWCVYCNSDGTVETVYIGTDLDIFNSVEGAYHVDHFIADKAIAAEIQVLSKEYVKKQINFPSTASFPWLDWSISRNHNIYIVSSNVTAENAFGVEDTIEFTLQYEVNPDTGSCLLRYSEFDGKVVVNKMSSCVLPERIPAIEQTGRKEDGTDNSILLVAGELGEYGKLVKDTNGEEYIDYHIPAGTYVVTSKVPMCFVYIEKNDYFINDSGYIECETVDEISFSSVDQEYIISVEQDEHIFITVSAKVLLTPKV